MAEIVRMQSGSRNCVHSASRVNKLEAIALLAAVICAVEGAAAPMAQTWQHQSTTAHISWALAQGRVAGSPPDDVLMDPKRRKRVRLVSRGALLRFIYSAPWLLQWEGGVDI